MNPGELWDRMTPEERAEFLALSKLAQQPWYPLPGPQSAAYESEATITGFGGSAGGGKTDLAIGLALTKHRNVMICRQNGTELTGIVDRIAEIVGNRDGYNGSDRIWRFGGGRQIELGSFPSPGDEQKYRGRPHDLLVFDEASSMRQQSVRFILGWLRTAVPGQRCRALLTFNPPTNVQGRWVVEFFAPWLDRRHPNPAKPGELRWFAMVDGKEREVGPEPFEHNGERIIPQSRTFIASRVTDNPYLRDSGYVAQLQALPEPLRSQMLYGDFDAGSEDDPWQVIPTKWVEAAMARWKRPDVLPEMSSIGVDVAMGGKDRTVIARRHGMWFDSPIIYPGDRCTDGPTVAGFVVAATRDGAPSHIDLLGPGAKVYGALLESQQQAHGVNVGDTSPGTDVDSGRWRFFNVRSELYWRMREALDPARNNGIALPPDRALLAELCAATWEPRGNQIKVAGRDEIVDKLGRSPDLASAYVLALIDSPKLRRWMGVMAEQRAQRRDFDPVAAMFGGR